jgi:hypothetical protein
MEVVDKPVILTEEELQAIRKKPALLNDVSYTPQITRKTVDMKEKPVLSNSSPAPKLSKVREKFSSTATMFFNTQNSCLNPNCDDTLRCVSVVIHNTLLFFEDTPMVTKSIWNENQFPITDHVELEKIPSIESVLNFLMAVFHSENLSGETAIMTIAYIDRYLTLTGSTFNPCNWRRITLSCIIVASKVWEDLAVWNADFVALFPKLSVTDLNSLEREMLTALDYVVSFKSSIYCKYYFDLRRFSELNDLNFPLKQLSQEEQNKLEHKSSSLEQGIRNERFSLHGKKSASFDPALLNKQNNNNVSGTT